MPERPQPEVPAPETARAAPEDRWLRRMANSVPALIAAFDAPGRVRWVNESWLALTGRSLEETRGEGWMQSVHPADLRFDPAARAAAARGDASFAFVYRMRSTTGEYRWLRSHNLFVRDATGVPNAIHTAFDVTDELEAQRRAAESENRFRSIFASMAEGVVVQDADGRILSANPAAERILGLSRDELAGRTSMDPRWRTVREDGGPLPGEEHPAMITLRTGAPQRDVLMGVEAPGAGRRWISVSSEPMLQEPGRLSRAVVATFTDITDRVRAQEALREEASRNERIVAELREALEHVKTLKGFLPICVHCHKIRDDEGYWDRIEKYISERSDVTFSHGLCPDCLEKHHPGT